VRTFRDLCLLAVVKLIAGSAAWFGGFRAVSDDDYARVVIAQTFAESPKLDPTGSSWLPFPFWLSGTVAMLVDTSLDVARAVAVVQGMAAVWLVYAAGRLCLADRREAVAAAVLAATLPWSARLGVATVPELLTAALCVFALVTLLPQAKRWRWAGGFALLAASLSRYEPWPVAACFSLVCVYDVWRHREQPAHDLCAAAVAAAGPLMWLVHNAVVHGDALAFVARVSHYREALDPSTGRALIAYPYAFVSEAPSLSALVVIVTLARLRRGSLRLGAFRIVIAVSGVLLVGLMAMSMIGGAPTHHPERAVLVLWLLAAMYVGAWAQRFAARNSAVRHAGAVVVALLAAMFCLRAGFRGHFVDRGPQRALGRAVAERVPRGEKVLLEVVDYGYFAVLAASGRPSDFVLDRSLDPRLPVEPGAFVQPATIEARRRAVAATFIAARRSQVTRSLGEPLFEVGGHALWRIAPDHAHH
jgi:hypothetical protein